MWNSTTLPRNYCTKAIGTVPLQPFDSRRDDYTASQAPKFRRPNEKLWLVPPYVQQRGQLSVMSSSSSSISVGEMFQLPVRCLFSVCHVW
mmetsp:Transcript_15987/g.35580  ORF Transcript_15987/g.35580 Transcript_15987/m.35580 type:complete len:90 (+) Transcript_15987:389-658(+)